MQFIVFLGHGSDQLAISNILNNSATTYPAISFQEISLGSARCIVYKHDSFLNTEVAAVTSDAMYLIKGFMHSRTYHDRYVEFLGKNAVEMSDLVGDFLSVKISADGTGEIKRPLMSFQQLYFYEAGDLQVLATDLSLITKSVKRYADQEYKNNFDYGFLHDSIINEWKARDHPNATFLIDICRIQTLDSLEINDFKLTIERGRIEEFRIDPVLEALYLDDRSRFYREITSRILESGRCVFQQLSVEAVQLLLTGGLDSRATLAVLMKLKEEFGFRLNARTGGPPNHPDVEIAKAISEHLGIGHEQVFNPDAPLSIPKSEEDYRRCFRVSLGNWNSNSYGTGNTFNSRVKVLGQDNYKRTDLDAIMGMNRWYAGRLLGQDILPILSIYEVNQAAVIYGRHDDEGGYLDFVYEIMKFFCPELLDIPFVGQQLPKHPVTPHGTIRESKQMPHIVARAYYDEELILSKLKLFRRSKPISNFLHASSPRPIRKLLKAWQTTTGVNKTQLGIHHLLDERRRRIAMDYASIADVRGYE